MRSGPAKGDEAVVYHRTAEPKGPLTGFGYGYLEDKLGEKKLATPALLAVQGLWGGGAEYAYEALNLVDGRRSVRQIHDDVAAIYGPVPMNSVTEYLNALEKIGLLARR
jgi:aminopeptidase YwaD